MGLNGSILIGLRCEDINKVYSLRVTTLLLMPRSLKAKIKLILVGWFAEIEFNDPMTIRVKVRKYL